MSRPILPNLLARPVPQSVTIDEREKRILAALLGRDIGGTLDQIFPEWTDAISYAIAAYQATANGSSTTNIGNTCLVLKRLQIKSQKKLFNEAMVLVTNERSGIDHYVFYQLNPLAKALINNEGGAKEHLEKAAYHLEKEYSVKDRVNPTSESFRAFCFIIRRVFEVFGNPLCAQSAQRRKFAMHILDLAEVEHTFVEHPDRLDDYLNSEFISPN